MCVISQLRVSVFRLILADLQIATRGGSIIRDGSSLKWLAEEEVDSEDLAHDHRMDISGSVYARMKELGINQNQLAELCGMDRSQISRIIAGKQNLTLGTLAKLEVALSFRMDQGFVYRTERPASASQCRSRFSRK